MNSVSFTITVSLNLNNCSLLIILILLLLVLLLNLKSISFLNVNSNFLSSDFVLLLFINDLLLFVHLNSIDLLLICKLLPPMIFNWVNLNSILNPSISSLVTYSLLFHTIVLTVFSTNLQVCFLYLRKVLMA